MKSKVKQIKKIKNILDTQSGMKSEPYGNRTRKTISIEVSNNEDITGYIEELLKVCYYCLDGNGVFTSPAYRSNIAEQSVTKVIELILELLPHQQMYCLDRIDEILKNKIVDDEKEKSQKTTSKEEK
ncbi:hypothetical protein NO995_07590 [Aestuariibaculum sp. M13]|uniref:hypothetical protein n=1 Tax=Aestuariibaculum sp. M13 TaxID=2967132 RepID=UPI002159EA78|nr:hypothetical protein [Aestuariibaculum sp. M13]MCR8667538.1 hypothetical protein [Aestuariibaculum sp. M13]